MGWRDMEDFRELPAAAETPIETYAREGKLMQGCLHGSSYETKMVREKGKAPRKEFVLDLRGAKILLIKCGKLCEAGETSCPYHLMLEHAKEVAKPSGAR